LRLCRPPIKTRSSLTHSDADAFKISSPINPIVRQLFLSSISRLPRAFLLPACDFTRPNKRRTAIARSKQMPLELKDNATVVNARCTGHDRLINRLYLLVIGQSLPVYCPVVTNRMSRRSISTAQRAEQGVALCFKTCCV